MGDPAVEGLVARSHAGGRASLGTTGGQRRDGTALAVATCTAALAEVGGCARQSGGITLHMRK